MKKTTFLSLQRHLLFWTVFIVYELIILFIFKAPRAGFYDYAGHYALNIGLFYFNALVLLPKAMSYNKAKRYYILPLFIIADLLAYVPLKYLLYDIYHFFHIQPNEPNTPTMYFIARSVYRAIYFIGLSIMYGIFSSIIENRKRIADLETIQLKNELQTKDLEKILLTTENAYLKSQINPHFLLNTLNFLYNSVSKFSDKIADSVLLLSDIMRYALTNADEDGKVMLLAEIDHIDSFIKLNQARFNERLQINFEIEGEVEGLRIIPLILITLVENVFKYGDLLNEKYPAKIMVGIENSSLTFVTSNLKRKKVYNPGYGIGLKNIKSRLTGYQYDLNVNESETEYKSILKIEL